MNATLAVDVAGASVPAGLFLFGAWWLIKLLMRDSSNPQAPKPFVASTNNSQLQLRVAWREDDDSWPQPHFLVECRGEVPLIWNAEMAFRHRIVDVTDGTEEPVIALLDWQQYDDSVLFSDITPLGKAGTNKQHWEDWRSLRFPIFPSMIRTPRSGQRTLRSLVDLVAITEGGVQQMWAGTIDTVIAIAQAGYLDDIDHERADDGLIVRLATAVSAASGHVSDDELATIQTWALARLSYLEADDPVRAERAEAINGALRRSATDAEAGTLDMGATISRFLAEGSETGRVEAIDLCLAVMRADGVADRSEMEVINRIAQKLEVDQDWFAENRDKSVSGLSTALDDAADYFALLGIDSSADPETIRKQLLEQYDRWNSRSVSLSDPEKRREAEQMLEIIAKARAELLSK